MARRTQVLHVASKTHPQDYSRVIAQKKSVKRQIYKPSVEIPGKVILEHQYLTHQYP